MYPLDRSLESRFLEAALDIAIQYFDGAAYDGIVRNVRRQVAIDLSSSVRLEADEPLEGYFVGHEEESSQG